MPTPLVTALIDTYNHERFIEQAILSVLEQDVPETEMEVIVVDDGSTDNTPAIVRKFAPRVRYLRKVNGGQASAFNVGIPEARGEIVAFLDGDDWWAPDKLRKVLDAFERNPQVGMVGHGSTTVWADGRSQMELLRETPKFRVDAVEGARTFRLRKSFLGTRSSIRASILKRVLPVPEEIRIEADEFIFTMAAVLGEVLILSESLMFYRIHHNNFFSVSGFKKSSLLLKQKCLAALAARLEERLQPHLLDPVARRTITECISVEAAQLRLSLQNGWPWETVRAELKDFAIMHPYASLPQWTFRSISLIPALVMPSRYYYGWRHKLRQSPLYTNTRKRVVSIPIPSHVSRQWHSN